jgi:ribose transport system permease protein
MTAATMKTPDFGRWARRNEGMLIALATLAVVFVVLNSNLKAMFSYYDITSTFASSTTLAIAAVGATVVVISRGLDLSAGAVISLSNCLIAANVADTPGSMILWGCLGVATGAVTGLFNAIFIVFFRLPSIIVTLASMFIIEGLTLLVMEQPGGTVPAGFSSLFLSDAIEGWLPTPAVLIGVVLLFWGAVRATRLGTYIYAVGSDEQAAKAKGVPARAAKSSVYIIAGSLYGLAGVFLTAQTGSGDPTVGPPMLLPIYVAIILGGTTFAGGRGGVLGTVFGAFTLMLIVNLLLVFNVPTFYSTVVEGALLIAAVLASSGPQLKRAAQSVALAIRRAGVRGVPIMTGGHGGQAAKRPDHTLPSNPVLRWARRNRADLSTSLPAWVGLAAVLVVTAVVFYGRLSFENYVNSLLVLTSFLAILALGQGVVVIGGGLDLSIPAIITFSGVMLCEWAAPGTSGGWALAAVLVLAALIGAVNGLGVGLLGIHPLIMTLAANGILDGLTLVITHGTPHGMPPRVVSWLMTGKLAGVTPVVFFLILFAAAGHLLLARSAFGRRLYATGSSPVVAYFSGVSVVRVQIGAYAVSAVCAAIVGMLLSGFSGQAFIDMGTPYLLPSIAVAVVGGVAMTGGRGTYLGMLGGALLLTALSTMLQGMLIPLAVRNVIFGFVVLAAVLGLRERMQ